MDIEERQGIGYITALSIEEIRCLINEGTLQLKLFSKDLAGIENDDVCYVLCTNPDLEKEQSQTRAALKAKFEDALHNIKLSFDARLRNNLKNKAKLAQVSKNKKLVTQFSEKQLDSYKYRVRKAAEIYHMRSFYLITITQDELIS